MTELFNLITGRLKDINSRAEIKPLGAWKAGNNYVISIVVNGVVCAGYGPTMNKCSDSLIKGIPTGELDKVLWNQ